MPSKRNEVNKMNTNDKRFMAEKIRTQYMEKTATELDALRELDRKVKRPANIFGYTFGSLSALIMGSGMSLVMTDIGAALGLAEPLVPGIIIGIAGLSMAILNYPIFKGILSARKRKFAPQIIALSDKIVTE